jgi:hypothetical protein
VLKLTLHATTYDWQFVPVAGGSFTDSGTGSCHAGAPSVQQTPPPGSPPPPSPQPQPPVGGGATLGGSAPQAPPEPVTH